MSPRGRGGRPSALPSHPLYPTLDLHGQTADEAERLAERWLEAQHDAGEGRARLITGRGVHSIGPPVLPAVIADLLRRLQGRIVASYQQEPGGGAFMVNMIRLRRSPSPKARAEAAIDPALALEAHQALAELGVDPTPALVRLEVERIVQKRGGKRE